MFRKFCLRETDTAIATKGCLRQSRIVMFPPTIEARANGAKQMSERIREIQVTDLPDMTITAKLKNAGYMLAEAPVIE